MTNYITKSINHHIPILFAGSLTGLMVLSGILLSASSSFAANTGNLQTTVNVAAACSLTVSPSSHTATINPGTTGSIGTSTIKSICNDPAGLAVYAVGYTDDTYGNNKLTATIAGNTYDISSNYTSSGTPLSSEWYMTLTPTTGTYTPSITTGFDSAHAVPDVYTKVAYRNTMTDIGTNATGAQFTASFNAYIAPTQAAGSYEGKVKFLLVHPNVLTYDSQTGQPDTVQPATLARDPEAPIGGCPANSPILQNVASWGSSVALGETVDAIDSRDNQCYKVKRLKMSSDGSQTALWMSNLNLGAETLTVSQLDGTNTHLASGVSAIPVAAFNSWIKSSGTESYTDPELISIKSSNTCTVYDSSWNPSIVSCPEQDSYSNKYGTLYNYAAASAGTYIYAQDAGTGNATSDLCPSGWRIPTGESFGEFQKLIIDSYDVYDITNYQWNTGGFTSIQQDLKFSLAGGFDVNSASYQGSYGQYWSSTFDTANTMCALYIDDYGLDYAAYVGRGGGLSIRCIAQ